MDMMKIAKQAGRKKYLKKTEMPTYQRQTLKTKQDELYKEFAGTDLTTSHFVCSKMLRVRVNIKGNMTTDEFVAKLVSHGLKILKLDFPEPNAIYATTCLA